MHPTPVDPLNFAARSAMICFFIIHTCVIFEEFKCCSFVALTLKKIFRT